MKQTPQTARVLLTEKILFKTSCSLVLVAGKRHSIQAETFLTTRWLNVNHTKSHIWTNDTKSCDLKVPLGEGGRYIVLCASSSKGFAPNGLLVFQSKIIKYHEEMNGQNSLVKNYRLIFRQILLQSRTKEETIHILLASRKKFLH